MILLELKKLEELEQSPVSGTGVAIPTPEAPKTGVVSLKVSGPIAEQISDALLKAFPSRADKSLVGEGMVAAQLEVAEAVLEDDKSVVDDLSDLYVFVVNSRNVTPQVIQEIENSVISESGKSQRAIYAPDVSYIPRNADLIMEAADRLRAKVLIGEDALHRWLRKGAR